MDQTNQEPPSSAAAQQQQSPRKKKAPLDLDAALYLQSQANYVQELNQPQIRHNSPLASSGQSTQSNLISSGSSSSSNATARNQNNSFLDPRYFYTSSSQYQNYNSNNISVDYIDCVSNDDLRCSSPTFGAGAPPAAIHSGATLRSMCSKKHLRFHRSHRIEPTAAASGVGADATGDGSSLSIGAASNNGWPEASQTAACSSNENGNANANEGGTSTSSVLYPISVGEVKKRTYFVGSLGQDDSLLGYEELSRYFPNNRVSMFVCTWNQNRKRAPMNLCDLLLPDQLVHMPDIYAIGIQEAFSSQSDYLREWEIELQTTLGPNHVLLHSCSLGVLHLALFVRRDLIWFCSTPEESVYNSRSMPTNMIKTKGAVSIAFRFFGTSFMFTNCHFPAHENKLKDRIDEYQRIINSIDLPKNLKLLKPRYLSNDSTARFDCVFFMGDLNFRLEQRTFDETISILEDIFQQKEPSYESLTQNDELAKVMESGQAFHGFDESPIRFPPTYKFLAQTNKYDKQTRRVPSYTDRILFRSKRQRHIQCLLYDWLPQLLSSDHKPVYSVFDVLIRPGHEQTNAAAMVGSLNAGLFQRTIYLEALKRRAQDPEALAGENGTGGSLICSIS